MANAAMFNQQKPVCRHLRTKGYYVAGMRNPRTLTETSPNAVYWCTKTAASVGPDYGYVCPDNCEVKRACFVALGQPVGE